jgi:hypothetical protein
VVDGRHRRARRRRADARQARGRAVTRHTLRVIAIEAAVILALVWFGRMFS